MPQGVSQGGGYSGSIVHVFDPYFYAVTNISYAEEFLGGTKAYEGQGVVIIVKAALKEPHHYEFLALWHLAERSKPAGGRDDIYNTSHPHSKVHGQL